MLLLGRKVGERICLTIPPDGREIWIEIDSINRGRVSVAIDAPRDVLIEREEVYRRKREQSLEPQMNTDEHR